MFVLQRADQKLVSGKKTASPARTKQRVAMRSARAARPSNTFFSGVLQRACACGSASSEREQSVQRSGSGESPQSAPPIVHDVLRSNGAPLDSAARSLFEPRFGRNLGDVRVHTGGMASKSARAVNAQAYTVGNHIVFRDAPDVTSEPGQRLLAHELVHVMQQSSAAPTGGPLAVGSADSAAEHAADRVAGGVLRGDRGGLDSAVAMAPMVARQEDPMDAGVPEPADPLDAGTDATARQSQEDCVKRLGGCPETRPGGVPSPEEIHNYNQQCGHETGYQGSDVEPHCAEHSGGGAAPSPVCHVDVRATHIGGILSPLPIWHLFVIYSDATGTEFYYRGGPGNPCGSTTAPHFGIQSTSGRYVPGTIDWDPSAPSVTVLSGAAACGKDACLASNLSRIHSACTPYAALGPNSNTVARSLLASCNIPQNKPVTIAPGWGDPVL